MHDVVVLSDLHLGRGRNPETGRYHSLETFFFDDDLRRFVRWLCADVARRGVGLRLVFNGDSFDFLRVEPERPHDAASQRERRFGAEMSPPNAAHLSQDILRGHPVFVEALADVLGSGHEVVFLPGNHDIEVQWTPVQEEIRAAVQARLASRRGAEKAARDLERLRFEPWFLHEPGRLWIEHGSQYDPECAFRYPLRRGVVERPEAVQELELDLPLGNFFQRYLYNAFGPLTFMVPSTRANARYSKWLLLNRPALLFRVLRSHGPFVVEVLRRLAQKAARPHRALRETHEAELADLAQRSGLGQKVHSLDATKRVREDVLQAVVGLGRQFAKAAALSVLVASLGAALWFTGLLAIQELSAGFGLKALLFLVLNFIPMAGAAVGLGYALFRTPQTPASGPLRGGAQAVVDLVDVPLVTFGHTHEEVVWPLRREGGGRAWYFNTGTWISTFTHDALLPREHVQFTFLHVKGEEAELLHWSPGRGEPLPVILLDEETREAAAPASAPALPEAA